MEWFTEQSSSLDFFAFMRLSNLAPHSLSTLDPSGHLTGHNVFFTKKIVTLLIKWSKTLQTRDKVQCITLPNLQDPLICPFLALKELFKLYPMSSHSSLFQLPSSSGSSPLTDSRVHKTLKLVSLKLGFHFPSIHMYQYKIEKDMERGHRTCVWQYIQSDHSSGESIAVALASAINNA